MQQNRSVRPVKDQVLVAQDGMRERVGSGLLYAPQGSEEWDARGTVIAVGPGDYGLDGKFIPIEVAPGDRVLFKRRPGTALLPDMREYESGERKEYKDLLMLRYNDRIAQNGRVELGDILGLIEED